jgi:hypothetical protein
VDTFRKYLSSLDTSDFGYLVNLASMYLTGRWDDSLTLKDFYEATLVFNKEISYQQICNSIFLELADRWGNLVDG